MTTITSQVIADSVSDEGIRLTTLQLRYPRWIHAEFMTHRAFSRNASSSRAVPVERAIKDIIDDPAVPLHWGKNQKGMQAHEEHDVLVRFRYDEVPRDVAWLRGRDQAVRLAEQFAGAGYHKQLVNRLLEPFSHINVVVSATDWTNFFALRDHPDAEPHIRMLAVTMKNALNTSTPALRKPGEWHLPYVRSEDWALFNGQSLEARQRALVKISAARCARVSYLTTEGKAPATEEDLALYERLVGGVPIHASPTEHQATPDIRDEWNGWLEPHLHGNFTGWVQHRKTLPNECIREKAA